MSELLAVASALPGRIDLAEWESIQGAISCVLTSGIYIGGPEVVNFENELAAYLGPELNAVSTACGQDSLVLALLALELPAQSWVITPPNDGGFSALAVQESGHIPLVVDVDAQGLISIESLASIPKNLLARVSALIVTHLHGQMADIEVIVAWARDLGIKVIEDCAQSIGAEDGQKKAGSFGDAATFSFYPTKNLAALGDAGAVVTASPALAAKVREIKQYGWQPRYHLSRTRAMNSRMDTIQAAILSARFRYLESNNEKRKGAFSKYVAAFPDHKFLGTFDSRFVAHHAVIVVEERDQISEALLRSGVGVDIHYPYLNSEMTGVHSAEKMELPHARFLAARILSLPCFPTISESEIETVIAQLRLAIG